MLKSLNENWTPYRRDFFACGSTKHLVRDCKFRDEYHESQRDHKRSEASYKKPKDLPDSSRQQSNSLLKRILRRKPGDEAASIKKKFSRQNEDGDWNSD